MRVAIDGALSTEVSIAWSVQEDEGTWKKFGKLTLPVQGGQGERPLPIKLPGRGLYRIQLKATSGGATAETSTTLGIVFTPSKPDPASPWASFYIPSPLPFPDDPLGAKANALSHKLLGASWTRLNFWATAYETITIKKVDGKPVVTADMTKWRAYAKALHDEGISIMGEISHCPKELSSRQGDLSQTGDAGEMQNRVKPRDYAEWDQLMEQVAREFKDEIGVWEIWNEVNLKDTYWAGTPEELAELIHHTSAALRRGNPQAKIAGCGFVHDHAYADKMFQLGIGKDLDILTVHYTDNSPQGLAGWLELMKKHKLTIPIWNSEEKSAVPLLNMSSPIERSFKFLHTSIGYPEMGPLVNKDFTPLPSGIIFSVGAHCLGTAKFVSRSDRLPNYDAFFFQRGEERIAALRSRPFSDPFGEGTRVAVTLAAEPLKVGEPVMLTDSYGRSRVLAIKNGQGKATLDSSLIFINGARKLDVLDAAPIKSKSSFYVFEAESGRLSKGWGVSSRDQYFGGKYAEIWTNDEPGEAGYTVEMEIDVPAGGRYEILFSGNTLTRLAPPSSLSAFEWSLDGGAAQSVNKAMTPLTGVQNVSEGLFPLGVTDLKPGKHSFRLKLTGRRATDKYYALWFDAIVLHHVSAESKEK